MKEEKLTNKNIILSSDEIRERFLDFFKKRNHSILSSASLIPKNDSSILFNTAGMQSLVPYLLGATHPQGKRLASSQKCVRTNDIEEVGDKTHFTFFEMLGNWSLGDYFKEDAVKWSYEFLTSQDEGLGLDPTRLYITVFTGNKNVPKDEESYQIWEKIIGKEKIYFTEEDNWWEMGENGPCGPDSEMFYDLTEKGLGNLNTKEFFEAQEKQDLVEIWNDVFMEFEKKDGKIIGKLPHKNVDTGAGLERITAILQKKDSPYETDLFKNVLEILEKNSEKKYQENIKDFRIIVDHLRTSVFLIADGIIPNNKEQGYVLRRLLRRSLVKMNNINFNLDNIIDLIETTIKKYEKVYPNLLIEKEKIISEIQKEMSKFSNTLEKGMKEFAKMINPEIKNNNICELDFGMCLTNEQALNELSGEDIFKLSTTYGFPVELIEEEAQKNNVVLDEVGFKKLLQEHQEKSALNSNKKNKKQDFSKNLAPKIYEVSEDFIKLN